MVIHAQALTHLVADATGGLDGVCLAVLRHFLDLHGLQTRHTQGLASSLGIRLQGRPGDSDAIGCQQSQHVSRKDQTPSGPQRVVVLVLKPPPRPPKLPYWVLLLYDAPPPA